MSRRNRAEAAQQAASEAGRALAEHKAQLSTEPAAEPSGEPENTRADVPPLPARRNEVRRQAMEELEQKSMERAGERGEAPPKVEEQAPEPEPFRPEQALQIEAEPVAEPVVEPEMVTIKVDGEESQVAKAEVDAEGGVAAFQIKRAMEKRLKATNDALAESKAMQAQMLQFMQSVRPQQPQQPQISQADFLKSKIQQIQLGTQEEAAQALQEVISRSMPQQVDPNALANYATLKMRQSNAAEQFKKEYGDLLAIPLIARTAIMLENEGLQQGIPQDFNEFYGNIGKQIRGSFGRQHQPTEVPQTTTPTSAGASEKEARKASIVNLPRAAGNRATPPEAPKPETREEILAQMRKSRGIPTG